MLNTRSCSDGREFGIKKLTDIIYKNKIILCLSKGVNSSERNLYLLHVHVNKNTVVF